MVDCDTNIRTVKMPDINEELLGVEMVSHAVSRMWCGPVLSSLWGCLEYWCCCVGCKRLYLGRSGGKNLDEMKADMNNRQALGACRLPQPGVATTNGAFTVISSSGRRWPTRPTYPQMRRQACCASCAANSSPMSREKR